MFRMGRTHSKMEHMSDYHCSGCLYLGWSSSQDSLFPKSFHWTQTFNWGCRSNEDLP